MQNTLHQLRTLSLLLLVAGMFLVPHRAHAATTTANTGIVQTLVTFGSAVGFSDTDPRTIVARLIRVAMGFVGIIVLLMILSSGASFMLSGGDEEKVKSAKRTFYNSIIGLIIMLSAYSIVSFVLNALTTANNPPLQ